MSLKKIFSFILMTGFLSSSVLAYTDRVDASAQEIYDAAKSCFSKEGIYKQNLEEKKFTTKWIYERIRRNRRRPLIPIKLEENVDLRYQLQVQVRDGKNYSEISVQGRFEEKGTDATPAQPWKHSASSKELYYKERESFFKILNCVEAQKKTALSSPSN